MKPILRNIFAFEDEDEEWKSVLSQFPNHVPRFNTKEEAIEFTKKHCRRGSNPEYSHLQHSITTLVDWGQVERILLPKIREYDAKWPAQGRAEARSCEGKLHQTIDEQVQPIFDYAKSRLDLPIHREMSAQSRMNTLKYTFYHMKCGIYVMIRQKQIVIFAPFVNRHYTNTWGDALTLERSRPGRCASSEPGHSPPPPGSRTIALRFPGESGRSQLPSRIVAARRPG
ncbi:hypothetical protein EON65_53595 [archaeon]|nr:MAG: hypothetical protein EON65_53595 [archaeon]